MTFPQLRRGRYFLAALVLLCLAVPTIASAVAQDAFELNRRNRISGAAAQTNGQMQTTTPMGGDVVLAPQQPSPSGPQDIPAADEEMKPFGWELFAANRVAARTTGVNPEYVIAPGDKIQVEIWGAQQASEVLTVDLQGNIFLPGVGPVSVAGRSESGLSALVSRAVSGVYTDQVRVYTNLLSSQPVGIYVTGAVYRPGHFAGERTDSVLYYLQQAGGIDLERGSFRDIVVKRQDRVLARIDLYDFLLQGNIPTLQFQTNDTIVVGPRRASVEVSGTVRNAYVFELEDSAATGADIIDMARPLPKASHVAVSGVRGGQPFNVYSPVQSFAILDIRNGDELVFQADLASETIFVSTVGQSDGPASFSVRRGTTLDAVLDIIPVDPATADLKSIYLRRESVAARQKQALSRALDELQRSVLTTPSTTTSSAEIRGQEAMLIQRFVEQARAVEPEGRVILAGSTHNSTLLMEEGDVIVVPQKSELVIISGEVRLPQTVVYQPGLRVRDYINSAGGYTERAETGTLLVLRQSGEVVADSNPEIRPGDHVTVLPSSADQTMAIFKDIVDIVYRIAVSSGVVIRIIAD